MSTGKTYSTKYLLDTNNNRGSEGQVLISTSEGVNWSDGSDITGGPYLPLTAGASYPLTGDLYQTMGAIGVAQTDQDYIAKIYELNSDGFMSLYTGQPTPLERIRISSYGDSFFAPANNGNVGIGTTSPGYKLQVGDNGVADGNIAMKANGTGVDAGAELTFNMSVGGGNADSYIAQIVPISYDSLSTGTHNSLNFKVGTWNNNADAGVSRMTILSNGNVGIGTTNPTYKLHVDDNNAYGGILIEGDNAPGLSIRDNSGTSLSKIYVQSTSSSQGNLRISSDDNNTATTPTIEFRIGNSEKARISDAGNVGIGTTNPEAKLGISQAPGGTAQNIINSSEGAFRFSTKVENTNVNTVLFRQGIYYNNTENATIAFYRGSSSVGGFMTFQTQNGNERMRIASNGNVGIGNTGPVNGKLVVTSGIDGPLNTVRIQHTRDDADVDTRALEIDMNLSGADTTTGDRTNKGIFVDLDSSADGDASNEHRIYGIESDVNFTGFSDVVRAGYFYAESGNITEKTAQLVGVYGQAIHDANSTNGGVSNMYGVYGYSQPQDLGDVDNAFGGYFLVNIGTNRGNADIGVTKGVEGEIQIDKSSTISYGEMMAVSGVIDNNEGTVPTFGNQYLFKGDYQGAKGDNAWGIYTEGDKHYFSGKVGIGTTTPTYVLSVQDSVNNADVGIHINNSFDDNLATSNPNAVVFLNAASNNGYLRVHGAPANTAAKHQIDLGSTAGSSFLTFSPGGAERMRIATDGNVGIGTTSPLTKLQIDNQGQGEFSGANSSAAGKSHIILKDEGSTSRTLMSGPSIVFQTPASGDGTNVWASSRLLGSPAAAGSARGTFSIQVRDNYDPFNDGTSWNWRTALTAINSGNVGIGTNSPGAKLQLGNYPSNNIDITTYPNVPSEHMIHITAPETTNRYGGGISFGENAFTAANITVQDAGGNGSLHMLFGTRNTSGTVAERMRITNAGNVGIGTTSPGFLLDVAGITNTSTLYVNNVDQNSTSRYGNLRSEVGFTRSPVAGNPNQWFKVVELGGSPTRLKFSIIATGDNTNSYDNFLISTSGYGMNMHIEKLPGGKYNTSKLLSVAAINPSNGSSVEIWIKLRPVSSGTGATYVACTSDVLASATILASATTTAPTLTSNDAQLDISNDNRLHATLQASRGATFGAKVGIGTNAPAAMLTVEGDSTISGNVGIGTTSPTSGRKLDVHGDIELTEDLFIGETGSSRGEHKIKIGQNRSNNGYAYIDMIGDAGATSFYNLRIIRHNSGANALSQIVHTGTGNFEIKASDGGDIILNSSGSIGISQTSPSYKLDVTGDGRFTSTVTATNFILSSDERLKENVEKVCNNRVKADWKTFELKTEKGQKRYGVIAQELEKTNPEFVREDSQGFKSVAYIDLLIAKIAELEARLEKLEK